MIIDHPSARWLKRLDRAEGPIYLGLVRALEAAIRAGELQPGDRLPPQRTVAGLIGVDFTTVTRAFGAARERGLVEGAVGRGTFVRARAAEDDAGLADLSMNLPPPPEGVSLSAMLRETTAAVLQRSDAAALMAYHPGAGTMGQKAAGAAWLAPVLGDIDPERVLISAGAQTALAACLAAVCKPGDRVLAQSLSYPGFRAVAEQTGLELVPCEGDEGGLLPDAVERACRERRPSALYLNPTMHNPTGATLSARRRADIARIAETHGLWIIEDDPYSRLMARPPAAVATFAPQRTFYIGTLSKCLSPGLRLAYLVRPEGGDAERIAAALRAVCLMPAPLMTAVVTHWIREGEADALLAGVRREAHARRALAMQILPQADGPEDGLHVWLPLPRSRDPQMLRLAAQDRGLSLVTADAFAAGPDHPGGVRISLGGPAKRPILEAALRSVAGLIEPRPAPGRLVV